MKCIKFSAEWCIPCQNLRIPFEEISKDENFKKFSFEEVDIEDKPDIARKFKVKSIPTILILDDNEEILEKIVGSVSKQKIISNLEKYL